MSLDATVLELRRDDDDVVLVLGPRITDDERLTLSGQSTMRIRRATWVPDVGMDLWGGDSIAFIGGREYRRGGYTRLYEYPLTPEAEAEICQRAASQAKEQP